MGLPVQTMVARNASSTTVNSGVNSRVSTGAMFSMTLCLASTSQDPTMTAADRAAGNQPACASHSASIPMA